jgi:hypothetical protein
VDRRRGRRAPAHQGPRRARAFPPDRREDGGPWCQAAGELAGETGLPLDAVRIGHLDGDLFDPRCTWLRHRQITSNGALLVRPDRFIGWRHMTMAPKPSRGASQRARTGPGTSARPGEAIRLGPGPGLNLAPGCPHILSVARSAGAATAVTDQHPGGRNAGGPSHQSIERASRSRSGKEISSQHTASRMRSGPCLA